MELCIVFEEGEAVCIAIPAPGTMTSAEVATINAQIDADNLAAERANANLAEGEEPWPLSPHIAPRTVEQIAAQVAAPGVQAQIIDRAKLPKNRDFRDAWGLEKGSVVELMPKARAIAHERRRSARAQEFAPWDAQATVPDLAAQAETERVKIRAKYDQVQIDMDAAQDADALRALVKSLPGDQA